MCGPRQLFFFHCGPETPKGWIPRLKPFESPPHRPSVKVHAGIPRFIVLYRCCVLYKLKAGPFKQTDYNSLNCHPRFIAIVWNRTRSISKVGLYSIEHRLFTLLVSLPTRDWWSAKQHLANIIVVLGTLTTWSLKMSRGVNQMGPGVGNKKKILGWLTQPERGRTCGGGPGVASYNKSGLLKKPVPVFEVVHKHCEKWKKSSSWF